MFNSDLKPLRAPIDINGTQESGCVSEKEKQPENFTHNPEASVDTDINIRQVAPFRYVDYISAIDAQRVCGGVSMAASETRFYSPDLYGCLLLESLAQLSSLLAQRITGQRLGGVLMSIQAAEFCAEMPENAEVSLSVSLLRKALPVFTFEGIARCDGRILCQCQFSTRSNSGDNA